MATMLVVCGGFIITMLLLVSVGVGYVSGGWRDALAAFSMMMLALAVILGIAAFWFWVGTLLS